MSATRSRYRALARRTNHLFLLPDAEREQLELAYRAAEAALAAATSALVASVDPPEQHAGRFRARVLYEGTTSDRRQIHAADFTWRAEPQPVMYQRIMEPGHYGAELAATVGRWYRDGADIWAEGWFHDSDAGRDLAARVRNQEMTGVSADLVDVEEEVEITETEVIEEGPVTIEVPTDYMDHYLSGVVAGFTVVGQPALADCFIEFVEEGAAAEPAAGTEPEPTGVAAAGSVRVAAPPVGAGGPLVPPAAWFADPGFTDDHPDMTWVLQDHVVPAGTPGARPVGVAPVLADGGRAYGHLATWGTCHIGLPGRCTTPPQEPDYSRYMTGVVRVLGDDGHPTDIACGTITLGTGHAPVRGPGSDPRSAVEHYDNSGTQALRVAAGADRYGIWFAGALCPGLTAEQLAELRACEMSGDWRPIGTQLRLVAALAVNVPGFGVPRPRLGIVAGAQVALVAAGVVHRPTEADRVWALEHRLGILEATLRALAPQATEALRSRLGRTA